MSLWKKLKNWFSKPAPPPVIVDPPKIEIPPAPVTRGNPTLPDWQYLWETLLPDAERVPDIKRVCDKIIKNKNRLKSVELRTGVPWYFIGALCYRESSLDFEACLHNGNPLPGPTTDVPKGRGPFSSWEEAAVDALKYDGLDRVTFSDPVACLIMAEKFNGLGYRKRGEYSPYVFAGSNHSDETGKYTYDGRYSASAPEKQLGVAVIIKALLEYEH